MKKTRFERVYGKKMALGLLPFFVALFIMVNMGLLYFIITMINIGVSDEFLDKLPYVLNIEFWIIGLLISFFVLFQITTGYGIILAMNQITTNQIKKELGLHKDAHDLME